MCYVEISCLFSLHRRNYLIRTTATVNKPAELDFQKRFHRVKHSRTKADDR